LIYQSHTHTNTPLATRLEKLHRALWQTVPKLGKLENSMGNFCKGMIGSGLWFGIALASFNTKWWGIIRGAKLEGGKCHNHTSQFMSLTFRISSYQIHSYT